MPRVLTALHLTVAHIDYITRPIAIYNDTYKFATYTYSTSQKFAVDNKVMVTSHLEVVRKLHAWHIDFNRILKRSAFIAYELTFHEILISVLSSAGMMSLCLLSVP